MTDSRTARAGLRAIALAVALALAGCATSTAPIAPHVQRPAGPVEINLVALNDFHGNLEPTRYTYTPPGADKAVTIQAGGIDVLGGALAAFRKEDKDLLLVAAGDLIGASPAMSGMFADEPTLAAMDRIGLVASSLGNHEFDQGKTELLRQQHGGCDSPRPDKACRFRPDFKGAGYTYLAANVTDQQTGRTLVPGWRVVDVKGVKIGLVGAVLKGVPSVVTASGVRGLRFQDEADAINATLPAMRAAGAQVFVVLIHEGGHTGEPYDKVFCDGLEGPIVGIVKRLDPAIRLVISGHSHKGYLCKVDGRVVTQGDAYGHLLSRIRMTVDPASGKVEDIAVRNVVMAPDAFTPDPQLSAWLKDVRARSQAELDKPVARIAAPLVTRRQNDAGESALGNVVADAALDAMQAQGVQVAFMNPGGMRNDLQAGSDGTVTFGQAQAVLPFGNTQVVMDLTGAQLRTVLEQQWERPDGAMMLQVSRTLAYQWDATKPKGSRIVPGSLKVAGVPVDDARVYRISANNFLAEGGDKFPVFGQGTNRNDTGVRDLDTLVAYLKRHPETGAANAAAQPRIVKLR
ncbi:bifunctional UDP-sugar hydrolase/5'-nucleotidase [uncultured Massilia sp.]|uniref:bifunctional metallophosphatase/5'-nucleotidase n=1 Tax=uncultured Massilia sp. TaxID=169973 RepID=UPI0025D7B760|nr:bifunctional metallophosphatase/5'-nucleotidase [uncultured Massilia sp.]